MTDFEEILIRIQTLDPVLIGIGILALLLLILLFRRPKDQTGPLRDALVSKELELRDAQTGAGRAEALAEERKTEIDRLNGDLSKLRVKLDGDAERASAAAARISALETQLSGAQEEAERVSVRHQVQIDELNRPGFTGG